MCTLGLHIKFSTVKANPFFLQFKFRFLRSGTLQQNMLQDLDPPLFLFENFFRRWRSKQRETYQKNTKFYYFFRRSLKSQQMKKIIKKKRIKKDHSRTVAQIWGRWAQFWTVSVGGGLLYPDAEKVLFFFKDFSAYYVCFLFTGGLMKSPFYSSSTPLRSGVGVEEK